MYQLCFYVPASHLEQVKEAVFAAGAGCIGNYENCAWQTKGMGQFMPKPGSKPYLGAHKNLETVAEFRVEMVCDDKCIKTAVRALEHAHPYETPAYSVWRLEEVLTP